MARYQYVTEHNYSYNIYTNSEQIIEKTISKTLKSKVILNKPAFNIS